MRWAEVSLVTGPESADAVTEILISAGCGGVASVDEASDSRRKLSCYFPVDDRLPATLDSLKGRVASLPKFGFTGVSPDLTVKFVEDADWATAWKSFFKPLVIGKVVIKPTWEDFDASPGQVVVELDPGMAFGTGNHPTTQMCVMALQKYIPNVECGGSSHSSLSSHSSHSSDSSLTLLDVGCGSGILAIAGVKLGASKAVGIDVDPIAVKAARENVVVNGVESMVDILEGDSPFAGGITADIVTANIVADAIIGMRDGLASVLKPRGILICSGIIEEREAEVEAALSGTGLRTVETLREGEWVTIVTEKP